MAVVELHGKDSLLGTHDGRCCLLLLVVALLLFLVVLVVDDDADGVKGAVKYKFCRSV